MIAGPAILRGGLTQGKVTVRRAFWTATLFAVGILVTIAAVWGVTAALGRMLGDVGRCGNYLVAAIIFVGGICSV